MPLFRRRHTIAFLDTLHPDDQITSSTVSEFERWRDLKCPIPRTHNDHPRVEHFKRIQLAALTETSYVMARLATDPDPWVRLALALNPSAVPVVLWGDTETNFGLAEDKNPWVRSAVWYRYPAPPAHVRVTAKQQ